MTAMTATVASAPGAVVPAVGLTKVHGQGETSVTALDSIDDGREG